MRVGSIATKAPNPLQINALNLYLYGPLRAYSLPKMTRLKPVTIVGAHTSRAPSSQCINDIGWASSSSKRSRKLCLNELYNAAIRHGVPVLRSDRSRTRRSYPGPWCVPRVPYSGMDDLLRRSLRTKLPPTEFTRLILKGRGPRRGALRVGAPGPTSCGSTVANGHSNPCRWSTDHSPSKTIQRQLSSGNTIVRTWVGACSTVR